MNHLGAQSKIRCKPVSPIEARRRLDAYLREVPHMNPDDMPEVSPLAPDWHFHQRVFPKLVRCRNWKERLQRTIDRWSDLHYATADVGCFMFACAAVDSMIGSRFADYHRKNLTGNHREFWRYIRLVGSHDFFDAAGVRTTWHKAQPGDILQVEVPTSIRGKVHISWAIVAEDAGQAIQFTVQGLVQEKLPDLLVPKTRIWSPLKQIVSR